MKAISIMAASRKCLELKKDVKDSKVASIWEEEIFKIVHPDDLAEKHLQELCFYNFVKRQPKKKRTDYYLMSKLRMKNKRDSYIPVLHRIFYVSMPTNDTLWLALCLYTPLAFDIPAKCMIINSIDGHVTELEEYNNEKIFVGEEKKQVFETYRQRVDEQRYCRNAFYQHIYGKSTSAGNFR